MSQNDYLDCSFVYSRYTVSLLSKKPIVLKFLHDFNVPRKVLSCSKKYEKKRNI